MYSYLHLIGDTTKDPCHVPFCRHRDGAEGCSCRFIRFPLDRAKREGWAQEIGAYGHLEKDPNYLSKICSCHFENDDFDNPPNVFPWTEHPEHYTNPRTERAKEQLAHREASRSKKMPRVIFDQSALLQTYETIRCDSIVLTFDTSNCTGHNRSTSMAVAKIGKGEMMAESAMKPLQNTQSKKFATVETQTTVMGTAELLLLRSEVEQLKKAKERLEKKAFGVHCLRGRDDIFKYYTGVSEDVFQMLFKESQKYETESKNRLLTLEDEILLTLMKLRLNVAYVDISVRFGVNMTTACHIVSKHIQRLHLILYEPMKNFIAITSSGSRVELTDLKSSQMLVNCTNILGQAGTESETFNKNKTNFKVVMGVTTDEIIVYCSEVFQNPVSKDDLFKQCEIEQYFKKGDVILGDSDHSLLKIVLKDDTKVNEFQIDDEKFRRVEHLCFGRTMRRLKNYQFLPSFPQSMLKLSTKIVQICAALQNYQNVSFRTLMKHGKVIAEEPAQQTQQMPQQLHETVEEEVQVIQEIVTTKSVDIPNLDKSKVEDIIVQADVNGFVEVDELIEMESDF